jgi:hypothetical protein
MVSDDPRLTAVRPLVSFIAIGVWFGCSELIQAVRVAVVWSHAA